jgi:predicted dehydrogenase
VALDYASQSGHVYHKTGNAIVCSEVPVEKGDALERELAAFIHCVRHRGEPVVSGEHGALALQTALTICHRIRQGTP